MLGLIHHQDTKSTKERQVEGLVLLGGTVWTSVGGGGRKSISGRLDDKCTSQINAQRTHINIVNSGHYYPVERLGREAKRDGGMC
jgi:hypothetical protein